jgi:hypothetical protein
MATVPGFRRFAFLAVLLALPYVAVASALPYIAFPSPYVVSASPHVASGFSRTGPHENRRATQTNAPERTDDSSWQSASGVITSQDSASRFRGGHVLAVAFLSGRLRPSVNSQRPLARLVRRASAPQHSLPLLI